MADGNGPILVEGLVELVLADGTTVTSQRPVVALFACRGSDRYPFCDTRHRRRVRLGVHALAGLRAVAAWLGPSGEIPWTT